MNSDRGRKTALEDFDRGPLLPTVIFPKRRDLPSRLWPYPNGGGARYGRSPVRQRHYQSYGIDRTGSVRNQEIDLPKACYFQRSWPGIEHLGKGRHRIEVGSAIRSLNLYLQIQKWQRDR